jgi:hypothetical protein
MRPEVREPLARTLAVLAEQGPSRLVIQALWIGDDSREEVSVSADKLIGLAAASRLGTRTRYVVERAV